MTVAHVSGAFFEQRAELQKLGYSESQIANAFGLSVADLRATASLESEKRRAAEESRARRLREKGIGVSEIGRIMGKNESSVRSLLQDARRPDERVER